MIRIKTTFEVVYSVRGEEKGVSFSNIPEQISVDEVKLSVYLTQEIARQENVEENDVTINSATCAMKFD